MKRLLALVFLGLPVLALAGNGNECRFQAQRSLAVDLQGVRSVRIETGAYDFHIKASSGNRASVVGRACTSSQEWLDRLQLDQRREGDRLIIGPKEYKGSWFGSGYNSLDVEISLPKGLPLDVAVGSGDADATGFDSVSGNVGSGDLVVRNIGRLESNIGSGDIKASDVGRIDIDSIGSGDLEADNVRGDVHIGSIGSGNAQLRSVGGSVEAQTIGSGNLTAANVGRDLHVRHIGSGDVDHSGVKGRVDIPEDD